MIVVHRAALEVVFHCWCWYNRDFTWTNCRSFTYIRRSWAAI